MITKFINAHFAYLHSPTKEQRLCFFAGPQTPGAPLHGREEDESDEQAKRVERAGENFSLPADIVGGIRKQLLDSLSEDKKTYGAPEAEETIKNTLDSIRTDMQEKFHLYSEAIVWDEQESTATNVRTILREEIRFFELLSQRANEQAHEKVRSNTLVAALEDRLQKYQAAYDKLHARYNDTTDDTIHKNLQAPMRVCEKLIRSLSKRVKKMKTQENDEQAHYLSELLREKQEDFAELNAEQLERYAAKADTSLARTGEFIRKKTTSAIDAFFARNSAAIEQKLRESDIAELSDDPERMISTTIDHLRTQFKQDILALGKYQTPKEDAPKLETPIQESFNDTFEKYTRASMPFASEAEVKVILSRGMPAAFCFGNEIHINIDHPQAQNVTDRARVIAHELTHFGLDAESGGIMGLRKITTLFAKLAEWTEMKLAIDRIWNNRDVTTGERAPAFESDTDYLHEILAIAAAHRKAPYTDAKDKEVKNLAEMVEAALKHADKQTLFLKTIVDRISKRTDESFEEFDIIVRDAVDQRGATQALIRSKWGERVLEDEPDDIRRGAREEIDAIWNDKPQRKIRTMNPNAPEDETSDEDEDENSDNANPTTVLSNIKRTNEKVLELKKLLPNMQLSHFSDDAAHDAEMQGVHAHTGSDLDKIHAEGMKIADEYLSGAASDLLSVRKVIENIINWEDLSPAEKANLATEWNFENASAYRTAASNGSDMTLLDSQSAKDRQEVVNNAKRHIDALEVPLNSIGEYRDVKKLRDANLKNYGQKKDFKTKLFGFLGQAGGAEWLCYYDIVKIFKIYQEAIVESYKAQQNVVTNRIAKDASWFLDTIPYGKPIRQIINRQARSADSEETDKYKTYLEQEGFTYKELFTNIYGTSLLDQNRNNVNRVRAILNYGAHHAWLYDLDRYNPHNVYGIDYAKVFTVQAFKELVGENEHGKKDEESRGYEKVNKHADIPPMIQDMKDELKKLNIFAIKGILKRIQEKGKLTHSNVWGMVTFINELRKNKDLLSILDKGLLDDIGNIGIGESAWSLTQFKTQRNSFMDWKKQANTLGAEGAFQKNESYLLRTIAHIEKKLKQFPAISGARDMDEAISIILSGKTYVQDGIFISIFQDDKIFNEYRTKWMDDANTTTSAAKTDDDFFGKEGSDVMLTGPGIIEELGTRDSTGRPTHQRKFPNFMSAVFKRYDELGRFDPVAQENFRQEMYLKLKGWFRTRICSNAASLLQFPKEADANNRNMLTELVKRQLVYRSEITGGLLTNVKNEPGLYEKLKNLPVPEHPPKKKKAA